MTTDADFTPWPGRFQEDYIKAGYWIGKPLSDILKRQCLINPHKTALIGDGQLFSFIEIDQAAARLAHHLLASGIRRGDRAVVQLPNSPEFYVTFWALLELGVQPVFALFNHNSLELEAFCAQLQPKLLIVSRRHKLFATNTYLDASLRKSAPEAKVIFAEDVPLTRPVAESASTSVNLNGEPSKGHDIAFFQLSGGSTNTPKLIPRTHDDYYYSIRQSSKICALDSQSVYLCALPAPHNFPLSSPGALGVWYAGGTVVTAIDPSPKTCFPLIERHGVTVTSLVPPLLSSWLNAALLQPKTLRSLQLLQVGGAKLPKTLAERIEPEFDCRLQQVFGMAEGLVCYTRLDDDQWHRLNTQGVPMSEADEIKIVDGAGAPVAEAETGRLLTRGPYTIRGYYRAEEHNRQVFDQEGFYATGDLVKRLPSGHLIVVGREKDQINRGGEKIAAEEVENLLITHPEVLQAALIAAPDDALGEKSCAFLVCKGEMPKAHILRKHLRLCGIADFKLPDQFIAIDSLPLTAVGKPDKSHLRRILSTKIEEPTRGHS